MGAGPASAQCSCQTQGFCYCSTDKAEEQMVSKSPGSLWVGRREVLYGRLSVGSLLRRAHRPMLFRGITAIKAWMLLLLLSTWHHLCPVESTGTPRLTPGTTGGEIWCHSVCVELSTHKAENDLGRAVYGIQPVLLWHISYLNLERPSEHCREVKVLEQRKCSSLGHYTQIWPAGPSGLSTSELVHSEINNLKNQKISSKQGEKERKKREGQGQGEQPRL